MQKNKKGIIGNILSFAEDKGFYIILGLCVLAIGVSGYVLFFTGGEPDVSDDQISMSDPLPDDKSDEDDEINIPAQPENQQSQQTDVEVGSQVQVEVPEESDENPEENQAPDEAQQPAEDETMNPVTVDEAQYVAPVKGDVLRGFSGEELVFDKTMGDWRTHKGTDFACQPEEEVVAIADGEVTGVYTDGMMGNCITITHDNKIVSTYSGLASNASMKVGMKVEAGDVIGTAGNSMIAESAEESHIHVEVTKDGEYIDILSLISE